MIDMVVTPASGPFGLNCLVVDDDQTLADALVAHFNAAGHHARARYMGAAARAYCLANPVEILVADVCLSGSADREGLDLLEWVRTLHPDADVVVMSGYGDGAMELRARRCGGIRFFHKPVDPEILIGLAGTRARERTGTQTHGTADRDAAWGDPLAADLQRAYLMGEDPALARLLMGFRPLVLSVARSWYGLNADDASDVFQELSIELMLKISKVRHLRPFVVGMTMNLARQRRRETSRSRFSEDDSERTVCAQTIDPGRPLEISRLMDRLAPLERAVIEALFLEDLSYAETASRLTLPIGSIGPTRNRALAAMRRCLTEKKR